MQISGSFERELTDARIVGYVMSKVEIVRDILSEVGQENLNEPLLTECMSRLRINMKDEIKSMRNVELKHVDALLRHLGLIKAKILTMKREDPFMAGISHDFKEPLTVEMTTALDQMCHHIRSEHILEVVHGLIVEKLTKDSDSEENMPLRDLLYAYLEEIEENEKALEIFQFLSQDILGKHATACFTYLVNK